MRRFILTIGWLMAIASTGASQTLEEIRSLLGPNLIGEWRIEADTNPSIGPMLVYNPHPTNQWPGFVGILPFGQDNEGQRKIGLYMSTRQAPLYILGFGTNITVITYIQRTNEICQKIFNLLHLSRPPSASDSDR